MTGLSREQLSERAGVPAGRLDAMVAQGVLTPSPDALFSRGDVRRARLVHAMERGGVPMEAVGTAIRNGDLSLAFFDLDYWERFGVMLAKTFGQLSEETGLSMEVLQLVRESMGYARPEPGDQVREDEVPQVELVKMGIEAGVPLEALARQARVWGENIRRIAEADSNLYHNQIEVPLLQAGMTESQVLAAGSESSAAIAPLLDQALVAMYHAQSEHTWMATVIETVQGALERAGLYHEPAQPPAMCFLDLSGYTRLTEERGDQAAAQMAGTLGSLVQRTSHRHGGRAVKWLGDGVMMFFKQPGSATSAALELVDAIPAEGLPPAHAGLDAGSVIFQDGDYFGRTVNIAARVAGHAVPGEVLVTDAVVEATSDPQVSFVDVGPAELKGLERPVRLHRAGRSSSSN